MPKVLVVDDSVVIRKMTEMYLTEAGLQAVMCAGVDEALAFLAKEKPDAVVSDISMPGKNGYEVCSYIRSQASLADVPVLFVSAVVNDDVIKKVAACGAEGVLKKPFQSADFKAQVLKLVAKKQPPAPAAPAPAAPAAAPAASPQAAAAAASAGWESKVKELEEGLERQKNKVSQLSERLGGLEAQWAAEKEKMKAQIQELEATLTVEREAAAEIIQRLNKPQDAPGKKP